MSDAPTLRFRRCAPAERPTGFDLGHLHIELGDHRATSEGRTPNQAFMIYITATDLADQARHLIAHRRKAAEIIGADSSFRISFLRLAPDVLELEAGGLRLGRTTPLALARAVASGVAALLEESPLDAADPVHDDLCSALHELRLAIDGMPASSRQERPGKRRRP